MLIIRLTMDCPNLKLNRHQLLSIDYVLRKYYMIKSESFGYGNITPVTEAVQELGFLDHSTLYIKLHSLTIPIGTNILLNWYLE